MKIHKYRQRNILVLEDEKFISITITDILKKFGHVINAKNEIEAKKYLLKYNFDLALIDLEINGEIKGLEVLQLCDKLNVPSFVVSGHEEEDLILDAYGLKCEHYLEKIDLGNTLNEYVREFFSRGDRKERVREFFETKYITQDEELISSILKALELNAHKTPILITGPSGSGKTCLARGYHLLKYGDEKTFQVVNGGGKNPELVNDEVFGHVKGGYTGADENKDGKFYLAQNGTVFIDEVGNVSIDFQEKLLIAIDEGWYEPIGSSEPIQTNAGIITATCKDLREMVGLGLMKEDFCSRIKGFELRVKPLNERRDDIPLLVRHYQKQQPRKFFIDDDAKKYLYSYNWYGNVRELKREIQKLANLKKTKIYSRDLPDNIIKNINPFKLVQEKLFTRFHKTYLRKHGYQAYLDKIKQDMIDFIDEDVCGNGYEAEERYGIGKSNFYRLMKNPKGNKKSKGASYVSTIVQ
ncbi:MAG: sigma-54-dependent Fis family transcriptional regulator [Bacteriovoracaceae bacterium]|nr:sigma-54-dependent Fis family transcriptional regulator [Bacteriovoracaceae bacterium]